MAAAPGDSRRGPGSFLAHEYQEFPDGLRRIAPDRI
jgi:hypothetical protein